MTTELQKKIELAAKLLGGTSTHREDWATTLNLDGFSLFIRLNSDKLTPMLSVPRSNEVYTSQHGYVTSINIGKQKTAEQIAQDIKRRLLPDALKYRDMINERLREHDSYLASQSSIKDRSCKALGIESSDGQTVTGYVNRDQETEVYTRVRANRNTVDLELTGLSIEQVEAIGKVLRKK